MMLNDELTHADDDYDFCAPVLRDMKMQEAKWRSNACTVAWIDARPKWLSVTDWSDRDGPEGIMDAPLRDPINPCKRTWRFSLIGGGQIKVTEKWVKCTAMDLDLSVWNPRTTLVVAAHVNGEQLQKYYGEIGQILHEMKAASVVLRGAGDNVQEVADRTAATFQALSDEPQDHSCSRPRSDRFYALLDGTRGCCVCRRPLKDEVSKLLGIGPDCARQLGVPHTTAAASKRIALRAQMLGAPAIDGP